MTNGEVTQTQTNNRHIIHAAKDSILEIMVEDVGCFVGSASSILKILAAHVSEQPDAITYTDPK